MVKNLPATEGDIRDVDSIPGLGRSPGGERGNPLQHSCLQSPMNREARRALVHWAVKRWTQLKRHSTHSHTRDIYCMPISTEKKKKKHNLNVEGF